MPTSCQIHIDWMPSWRGAFSCVHQSSSVRVTCRFGQYYNHYLLFTGSEGGSIVNITVSGHRKILSSSASAKCLGVRVHEICSYIYRRLRSECRSFTNPKHDIVRRMTSTCNHDWRLRGLLFRLTLQIFLFMYMYIQN